MIQSIFHVFFFFKISPCIFFYRFTKKKFLCIVTLLFLKFLISYYPIIVILYSITELGLCGFCGICGIYGIKIIVVYHPIIVILYSIRI
ncbi:hypothetical protein GLOIN_2v1703054 [Rhizophagus irregularis DAOM 181602=DAOM 197198]|uniref:Uncharacterized protein n=1 Tax=Rhizophagus irregularis (strain DAOM 181602 / DAOM 197198 / MUCL 43194) TaxID=747089 RepID=A0A2P4P8B3_RHIID|nr:hypothetical protein GLOIN_2v1703054 [Rhizophagus irregularis DAOM 181602=DAOM 197198]POG61597.1 hypothetical protein GLOIN_2v1703054 [Rhizophagus irregularis DAOM 181602=DAOM 197198]GET62810.1 hypothetical protein GLOIN_2v1703054 [Rhizophagus irregularis DAOM 181602=DAOM 197198]|eukprot:XP_025168463.1 hypothetical protein GLOIN_2v1703054 [Rhizophagus irregularis DAOM 181602=DAOM 197198]